MVQPFLLNICQVLAKVLTNLLLDLYEKRLGNQSFLFKEFRIKLYRDIKMSTKKITFTDKYVKNGNFGINFEVEVTQKIICQISQEALQDIKPENRTASVEEQFTSHQAEFERIAEEKIRNLPDRIIIGSADVLK